MGGGWQILVKSFAGIVCVYKNTAIEWHVQVWNVWMLILFVIPLNCQIGGGIFLNSEFFFFFYDLHLQIIASISPKASVENSSDNDHIKAIFNINTLQETTFC